MWTRLTCLTLVLVLTITVAGAADWPGWRGPARDGKSPDSGLLKQWPDGGPGQIWKKTGFGEGFATVAVTGGSIYTTGHVNEKLVLFALDMDGNERWRTEVDNAFKNSYKGSRGTPVIDGERIFVLSGGGLLAAFNTADGKLIWQKRMQELGGKTPGWGYSETPLVHGDKIIATPGGENAFAALDKATGEIVWQSTGFSAKAHYSSPILVEHAGIETIVNGTGSGIFGVDPENGKLMWSNPFGDGNTANCSSPVAEDGIVFWSIGYGKGCVGIQLVPENGTLTARELYQNKNMVNHHGGFIVLDGNIYGNHNNGWSCLDIKSGEVKWHDRGVGKGSVCFADGMLYTFSERGGELGLVEATTEGYRENGRFNVEGTGPSWAHPVVINGRLYLRYADNLYCFDVRKPG